MKIEFHGADRDVTGSCHLIEAGGVRLLIDCGLYQGGRELEEENSESFGFEPGEIDYVLLTHAHLDHCGRLPLLVKRGFQGEIITTSASRELARLVLLDSAHLQEEEARYQNRRAARRGEARTILPLYDSVDTLYTFDFFGRTVRYDKPLRITDGITATFLDAGHILGSASILLEIEEQQGRGKRILFSGDLGYRGRAIIRDPAAPPHADYVVMETTYGDRLHKTLQPSLDELYQVIRETLDRGGNVIIPTFAMERAQ